MLLQIANVLTPAECRAINSAVADESLWRDGKETAAGAARRAKANLQADRTAAPVKGALAKIQNALLANAVFNAAGQPDQVARMLLSRYENGMAYGDHVDAPYIDGVRCDVSFTVFLNDPDDYEGGALVIRNAGGDETVRGPAGSVAVYPSTAVHCVEPVRSGARLACVGWLKSRVKSAADREIIYDVESALADLAAVEVPASVRDRLANVRNNLLRRFGD
ncbi:MAG: Fe2+-dependent dioxygenase [Hyphococcus sp.]